MNRKIIIVVCLIFFASCKEKVKTPLPVKGILKKEFKVEMSFKSNREDIFKIMLNNIVVDEFQSKSIHFNEKILATTNEDKIEVNFGDNKSKLLLINFGNKNEKTIDISNLKLSYNQKDIIITSESISNHFLLNKFVSINDKYQLVTKTVNGQHNPVIVLKVKTLNELFSESKKSVF